MARIITKVKSRNLFGETREQERKRLLGEKVKLFQGKRKPTPKELDIPLDAGTTIKQRKNRDKILCEENLCLPIKRYSQVYK